MGKIVLIFLLFFVFGRKETFAQSTNLPEIQIKSRVLKYREKGDTLEFNSVDYNQKNTFKLSSLLEGMPGFRVDENGRVFFNGKEIQRVFINGDDISGEQYSVLIKNLRAGLVEKVQLIKKFNGNRLMKHVNQTDDLAVNLMIKKEFLGKLNGSIEGIISRESSGGDSEHILLKQKTKAIGLIESSGKGFEMDNLLSNMQNSQDGIPEVRVPVHFPEWQEYFISDIPLFQQFDGRRGSVWTGIHFKTSKADEFTVRYANDAFQFDQKQDELLILDEINQHQQKTRGERIKGLRQNLNLDFKIDRGNSCLVNTTFQLVRNTLNSSIHESTTGMLNGLQNRFSEHDAKGIRFRTTFTKSLSKSSILVFDHQQQLEVLSENLVLGLMSERIHDSLAEQVGQQLQLNIHHGKSELKWMHGGSQLNADAGIRSEYFAGRFSINDADQSCDQIKVSGFGRWGIKLHKRLLTEFQFALGGIGNSLQHQKSNQHLIYGLQHSITYQPKAVSKWFQEIKFKKSGFDLNYYYEGSFLNGHGVKQYGNASPALPSAFDWKVGYMKFNLHRGFSYRALLQFSRGTQVQVLGLDWRDGYEEIRAMTAKKQLMWNGNIQVDQFIFPWRSKLSFGITCLSMIQPMNIGKHWIDRKWEQVQSNVEIKTQWKKKLNIKLNGSSTFSFLGKKNQDRPHTQVWNSNWGLSLIMHPVDKMNISIRYMRVTTGVAEFGIHFLHADFQYFVGKRWRTGVKLINALNSKDYSRVDLSRGSYHIQRQPLVGRQAFLTLSFSY